MRTSGCCSAGVGPGAVVRSVSASTPTARQSTHSSSIGQAHRLAWPAKLTVLRSALEHCLADGVLTRSLSVGGEVRVALRNRVRDEFISNHQGKTRDAKRAAFNRAMTLAVDEGFVFTRENKIAEELCKWSCGAPMRWSRCPTPRRINPREPRSSRATSARRKGSRTFSNQTTKPVSTNRTNGACPIDTRSVRSALISAKEPNSEQCSENVRAVRCSASVNSQRAYSAPRMLPVPLLRPAPRSTLAHFVSGSAVGKGISLHWSTGYAIPQPIK